MKYIMGHGNYPSGGPRHAYLYFAPGVLNARRYYRHADEDCPKCDKTHHVESYDLLEREYGSGHSIISETYGHVREKALCDCGHVFMAYEGKRRWHFTEHLGVPGEGKPRIGEVFILKSEELYPPEKQNQFMIPLFCKIQDNQIAQCLREEAEFILGDGTTVMCMPHIKDVIITSLSGGRHMRPYQMMKRRKEYEGYDMGDPGPWVQKTFMVKQGEIVLKSK